MPEPTTKVRDVAWNELFPWLMLMRSVRIALMARVLVLATIGLILMALGWWVLGRLFAGSEDAVIQRWRDVPHLWIWEESREYWVRTSAHSADEVFLSAIDGLHKAPMTVWLYFTRPFMDMFRGDLTATGFLFLLLCCVWELIVWGLIGGAITRIAALRFTRDEAPGPIMALRHAARKWPSYSLPVLIAMGGAAVFGLQLLLLGFCMRIDVLAFAAALIWPFVIVLGLMMAVLLLGALAGWPLMWATVSVEGTDAFDALSRSYAYTYHRPWRLLCYVLFAGVLAIVSMFVVKLFATSAIALGDWSIDWGLDEATQVNVVRPTINGPMAPAVMPPPEVPDVTDAATVEGPPELSAPLRGARRIIYFWKSLVASLAAGYQAGFLWVSAVGIYLLLRRDIDGVQMSEVYIDAADEYGMPPLADEATSGIPEVAPGAPAVPGDRAGLA